MKKLISAALAALTISAALNGCMGKTESLSPVRALSSSAEKSAEWLTERLGADVPENDILLGIADDADAFGADMTGLRSEVYVIRSIGNDTVILGKTADGLDRGVRYYANYCKGESGLDVTYGEGPKVGKLTIAGHDISEYSIRIEADADELHPLAANQLRKYIGDACGIYPEIDNNASGRTITLVQDKSGAHGDEAFTVEVAENGNVTITGGQYRGCIYGVYDFLENFIGYRFLYDFDSVDPELPSEFYSSYKDAVIDYLYEASSVDIPEGTEYYSAPDIASRSVWHEPSRYLPAEDFALKMKLNREDVRGVAKYNGYGVSPTACHGLAEMADRFADYSGQGVQTRQPCFSNEENIEIACEYYTEKLRNMLASGLKVERDITDIDISQVDSADFCQCKNCMELIAYDRTNAAPVVYFTNAVADAIAEIDPNVYVQMFAYYGTTQPPLKTKLKPNVSVWYCFYNDIDKHACYNHPHSGEKCTSGDISNALYGQEMRGWSKLTDRLGVWYYPGTWYAAPVQSCTVFNLIDDFRFFRECGVTGTYICATFLNPADGILNYLCRILQWSSDYTDEEFIGLIKEYFMILYGPGYEDIYEYMVLWKEAGGDNCWSTMGWSSPADRVDLYFYAKMYGYMTTLFDDAAYLAESSVQEYRIKHLSMQMHYVGLIASYDGMYTNGSESERSEYLGLWNDFVSRTGGKYPLQFDRVDDSAPVLTNDAGFFDGFDITKQNPAELGKRVIEIYPSWWKK